MVLGTVRSGGEKEQEDRQGAGEGVRAGGTRPSGSSRWERRRQRRTLAKARKGPATTGEGDRALSALSAGQALASIMRPISACRAMNSCRVNLASKPSPVPALFPTVSE